jgi:hypothetical protein
VNLTREHFFTFPFDRTGHHSVMKSDFHSEDTQFGVFAEWPAPLTELATGFLKLFPK